MKKSIRRQLIVWVLIPLLSLFVLSTAVAYYLGAWLACDVYDKQLLDSADSVAARIKTDKDNRLTVDLPPAAEAILRHNYEDEFYFQIVSHSGTRISGDEALPLPPPPLSTKDQPTFRTIDLNGKSLRVVCLPVRVSQNDHSFDHIFVQAAETEHTRMALTGQITIAILSAQLLLIVSGLVAIWIGIGRGLLPLSKVEAAVAARSPTDLTPLAVDEPVEVASLVQALNQLFKQLSEDREMQRRFTSNAAHQLRTPLAVLGVNCDLAFKLANDVELRHVLGELSSGIVRMSKLVNRLLSLARAEPGSKGQVKHLFDMNDCASKVSAALVPEALRKKIEVEFLCAAEPALVYGDQNEIEELISNLVENSILYTPSGGTVKIKVAAYDKRTSVTVADDGPGIPADERNRVFERFYRLPGTEEPGTGLGLSIVKEIASAHGAKVEISYARDQKGNLVVVTFPEPPPIESLKLNRTSATV